MIVAASEKALDVSPSPQWMTNIVRTREELQPYANEWNALLESSASATVFLTWEWISAWLETVYPQAELFVIAVRDTDGQLVALAPFYKSRMRWCRLVDYGCLRILGDAHSGAEYPDIIIRRGFEDPAMARIMQELSNHAWDCLWVPKIAGWSGSLRRWQSSCLAAEFHWQQRPTQFAAMTLPDTYEAYLRSLSSNARSNLKRQTQRLMASHQVELQECETKDDLAVLLEALFDLHHRRWLAVGEAGSFLRRPWMAQFYRRFAAVALQRGWLRLYALKVDGVIQAVQYGYAYHGVFSQMQEGFVSETSSGIGNVLRSLVIKSNIKESLAEYDFLGAFTEHKRRWGARRRIGHDLFIGRPSIRTSLLFSREFWPTGRFLKDVVLPRAHTHKEAMKTKRS